MEKRLKIEAINGTIIPLTAIHPLTTRKQIQCVWNVYDEKRALENAPFHPKTGEKATSIYNAHLEHHEGVFLEEHLHDWTIGKEGFSIHSHAVGLKKPITLLIVWTE